ncbi:hypothetical protein BN2475_120133 [Paraburkholderia ribeironis]|uniref:Uncharacterized protein n=1 Tax=Paraburkholderia ribeironis TaxID=1247936 RepID=A0A1N7RRF3_9BURK|nr:hypothetical protein BN2475_120133 [Paraburkholderia ribeironis]
MYTAVPQTSGRIRGEPVAVRGHRVARTVAGDPAGRAADKPADKPAHHPAHHPAHKPAARRATNLTSATASNLTTHCISNAAGARSRSLAP